MAVADVLISKVLDSLISFVSGEIEQKVKLVIGVENEIKMLTTNLQSIQAVLIDAEKKELKQEAVKLWLGKLKLISYDIDDVLDEWITEILRSKIEGDHTLKPRRSKVRSCILSFCHCFRKVGFRHDIAIKIRELNESLDIIAKEKERYNFQLIQGISEPAQRPMSTSVVNIPEVKGREYDKNVVVDLLLVESKQNPHVISIVGIGGIGKTTLAQVVYIEDRVKSNFDVRIWVCVSDPFDEMRIAKAILESLTGTTPNLVEMQNIVVEIQKYIKGKRFLLVLDDVWNENARKWKQVERFLKCGSLGSKILVTTRKENVARTTGCSPRDVIQLGLLSNEECWTIFSQVISPEGNDEWNNKSFEEIGRKIVEKCKGLPLAVNTIGGLLRFKESIEEWQQILDSELWELEEVESEVFATLRLSFDDLSSSLKQCFLYCSIFPKDHKMSKKQLIAMWVGQGYARETQNTDAKMMGDEHFHNLAMRSFFQNFEFDECDGTITFFKMHDVVHDFAQSLIMKKECTSIEVNNLEEPMININNSKIFHVGVVLGEGVSFPGCLCTLERLRSLVVLSSRNSTIEGSLPNIFDQLTCLRTLSLHNCGIEKVPTNISKLVHLRQLDLSWNSRLKGLPQTICKLYNLETLDVGYCFNLESLPREIGKLVNLKCLYNEWCTVFLPKEIGKLSGLQRLDQIQINHSETEALCLADLKNLNKLGGSLEISWRGQVRVDEEGVLKEKKNLSQLRIFFSHPCEEGTEQQNEELMEALEAHPNLKYLKIHYYNGTKNPSWISRLTCLRKADFSYWSGFVVLPPLGKLPSLEYLEINSFDGIKRVGVEFLGMNKSEIAASSAAFPKLTTLEFNDMSNWEEWNDDEDEEWERKSREEGLIKGQIMPCLQSLILHSCPKLKALPSYILHHTSLEYHIRDCDVLQELLWKDA